MMPAAMVTPGQSKSPWYSISPPAPVTAVASRWNAVDGWPSVHSSGCAAAPSSPAARRRMAGFSQTRTSWPSVTAIGSVTSWWSVM
jgi:hypothetical protein